MVSSPIILMDADLVPGVMSLKEEVSLLIFNNVNVEIIMLFLIDLYPSIRSLPAEAREKVIGFVKYSGSQTLQNH